MKKSLAILFLILTCIMAACSGDISRTHTDPSDTVSTHTEATSLETKAPSAPAETDGWTDPTDTTAGATIPVTGDSEEEATAPTKPEETVPPATTQPTVPEETDPPAAKPTDPAPAETEPAVTTPPATEPEVTDPPETQPPATEAPTEPTEPETEPTEEEKIEITESFKQEVAYYAAYYINQYRIADGVQSCTILPGMTLVAEYRADQLTYNYSHSTADKREALAYYQYGRYVDATLAGLDASASYYEADSAEAICAGFEGKSAEAMGKYIADLVRNSSNHWGYVGSSTYSYIGIGVEYRAGSTYGWYGCIMVGKVNYG